jgi:hypothetical protein
MDQTGIRRSSSLTVMDCGSRIGNPCLTGYSGRLSQLNPHTMEVKRKW